MKHTVVVWVVAMCCISQSLSAATYYVKSNGSDAAAGLSDGQAWKTVARVNSQLFAPGDKLLFRRGDVWRETLALRADGLTVGACGEGALPVISGADPAIGLARSEGSNVWTATVATNPVQLFIDGVRGQRMSTAAEITSDRRWHWERTTGTLLVYAAGSVAPTVEVSVRDICANFNSCRNTTIKNLRFERAGFVGICADRMNGSTIQDCEVAGCYINGIRASETVLRTNMVFRHNTVTDCGGMGIGFGGRLDNWIIESNEVVACGVLTSGITGCGDRREVAFGWTGGIKIWGWGGDGWAGYYTIRNNIVRDCKPVSWAPSPTGCHGNGIWCDEVLKPTERPEICGNIVHDCYSHGVYLEKCDDHDAFNNLIYRCAEARYTAALEAQSNPFGYDVTRDRSDNHAPRKVSGNRLFKNTVAGGWWSLSVSCDSPSCVIENTEVRDNICVGNSGRSASLYLHGGGANDGTHGTNNTYAGNCFGREGGSWVWGSTVYRNYDSFEGAANGAVTDSVRGEQFFMNKAKGDFRLKSGLPGLGADELLLNGNL